MFSFSTYPAAFVVCRWKTNKWENKLFFCSLLLHPICRRQVTTSIRQHKSTSNSVCFVSHELLHQKKIPLCVHAEMRQQRNSLLSDSNRVHEPLSSYRVRFRLFLLFFPACLAHKNIQQTFDGTAVKRNTVGVWAFESTSDSLCELKHFTSRLSLIFCDDARLQVLCWPCLCRFFYDWKY